MDMFQKLYGVEQEARNKNFSPEERYKLRFEKSLPLLNELNKWMVDTWKTSLPKSLIGKAVAYCLPRWDNLINYLQDGSLEIDNNLAENASRPIALAERITCLPVKKEVPKGQSCFIRFSGYTKGII